MLYVLAAELLVLIHFGFVLFVILGALLVLRWRWLVFLHVPAAIWGAAIEFLDITCPLTPMEKDLRQLAGGTGYNGSFIDHYVGPILYPEGLTETVQTALGLSVILINAALYTWVISRSRSARR